MTEKTLLQILSTRLLFFCIQNDQTNLIKSKRMIDLSFLHAKRLTEKKRLSRPSITQWERQSFVKKNIYILRGHCR